MNRKVIITRVGVTKVCVELAHLLWRKQSMWRDNKLIWSELFCLKYEARTSFSSSGTSVSQLVLSLHILVYMLRTRPVGLGSAAYTCAPLTSL